MATIRVTLSYTFYSQLFQNVLHFNKPDFVVTDYNDLITQVKNNWINEVKWIQTDGVKYINMKMHNVGASQVDRNEVLSVVGSAGGSDEYKPFNAHIIRIQSAFAGRKGRGRVYIGGLATNFTSFGVIKATILSTWATHLTNIVNAFGPSGSTDWSLGVNAHNETDDFHAMQSLSINPVEGIQRRRNIGIGI